MSTLPIPEPSPQEPSELAVELLKEAKKLLPKSSSSELPDGICYALASLPIFGSKEMLACNAIQKAISQGIAPQHFYSSWVNTKLGAFQDSGAIQEARHRWVDQLIVDFGGAP